MKKSYKCSTCGVISEERQHLCSPQAVAGKQDYCGQPVEEAGPVCGPMSRSLEYECGSCGRPAEKPDMVCNPERIG